MPPARGQSRRPWLVLQANELRGAKHRRVAGDHRVGERTARFQGAFDDRQEADLFARGDRPAIRMPHEVAQQTLGILPRIVGHHVHRRVRARVIRGFEGQVVEEQAVSRRRPLVVKRPLDLEPAERHAGAPVRLRERVPVTRRPRAEQPRGVGTDRFAGEQPDVELLHRRLRPDVETAEPAEQARGRFGVDRHRLGAAAGGNVVQVGSPPLLPFARPDPHRERVEANPVMTGRRRLERVEPDLQRLVGAGHHADGLELPLLGGHRRPPSSAPCPPARRVGPACPGAETWRVRGSG